ncbi:MAG: AMP-binding protein [Bryobacterales bacterium]|nr:AMP-binding protein [Bryobacterales bacterium]
MMSGEPATLPGLLRAKGLQHGGHVALAGTDGSVLTYSELAHKVSDIASRLRERGVTRQDRVAIVVPDGPAMALAFLGAATCAVSAPLNPNYRQEEFEYFLTDLRAKILITAGGGRTPAVAAAGALGIEMLDIGNHGHRGDAALDEPPPDAVALVLHTSGTTAKPKQVPLAHANLMASARNICASLNLSSRDRCLNVMPLFHIHGLAAGLLAPLCSGGSVICTPGFLVTEFFAWARALNPTWYTAVPTMHQALLARAETHPEEVYKGFRLARSSSSPLAPATMRGIEGVLGAPLIEAYGMTEAAHQIASNRLPPGKRQPGSVGRPAGPDVAVMNDAGDLLAAGEIGEIVIRGPNVMPGYVNNPEANRSAFLNGWFRTGDQGYLDAGGALWLTGRIKEIINRGGEKISPREIDEVLLGHPAVQQAVTFAMPDPLLGEGVAAAVVLRDGLSSAEQELRAFVAARVAYFKVPARIVFVREIPKGPTGKPQRIGLAGTLGVVAGPVPESASHVPPDTEVERLLAILWEEVLKREGVGATDDFLSLGGNSILAAQLAARISTGLGIDLSVGDLFDAPTVRAQAAVLEAILLDEPAL